MERKREREQVLERHFVGTNDFKPPTTYTTTYLRPPSLWSIIVFVAYLVGKRTGRTHCPKKD
jgi:hypothetical protein